MHVQIHTDTSEEFLLRPSIHRPSKCFGPWRTADIMWGWTHIHIDKYGDGLALRITLDVLKKRNATE